MARQSDDLTRRRKKSRFFCYCFCSSVCYVTRLTTGYLEVKAKLEVVSETTAIGDNGINGIGLQCDGRHLIPVVKVKIRVTYVPARLHDGKQIPNSRTSITIRPCLYSIYILRVVVVIYEFV